MNLLAVNDVKVAGNLVELKSTMNPASIFGSIGPHLPTTTNNNKLACFNPIALASSASPLSQTLAHHGRRSSPVGRMQRMEVLSQVYVLRVDAVEVLLLPRRHLEPRVLHVDGLVGQDVLAGRVLSRFASFKHSDTKHAIA